MRQILLAGKKTQKRPPLLRLMIANCSSQHRIPLLEGIQHGPLRHRTSNLEGHLAADAGERSQVLRQLHSNHASVCTSTDNTPGRSRTIVFHESPASADAYTCPPLVPK